VRREKAKRQRQVDLREEWKLACRPRPDLGEGHLADRGGARDRSGSRRPWGERATIGLAGQQRGRASLLRGAPAGAGQRGAVGGDGGIGERHNTRWCLRVDEARIGFGRDVWADWPFRKV
jgi:hypothetical protein